MTNEKVPSFEFDADQIAKIKAKLEITEEPPDGAENVIPVQPPPPVKRKRGRPRKHPVSETGTTVPELAAEEGVPVTPARLTRAAEKELSERLTNLLIGGTGLAAGIKPYLQMTEDEAKNIADPVSSYLQRNVETMAFAQQVVENYDLLAIVIGVLTYVVRIYNDRAAEIAEQQRNRPRQPTISERMEQHQNANNNGQTEGLPNKFGTSYVPEPSA